MELVYEMKRCKNCGKLNSLDEFYYCANTKDKRGSWCKECDNRRRNKRRARFSNDEKAKARVRYIRNKDKINTGSRRRHFERKELLIAHYSGGTNRCACCGESNIKFLTIDHIAGGGNEHRRSLGFWGGKFYCWLIKEKMPRGYQVLCFNCNMGRSAWGSCPHKEKNGSKVIYISGQYRNKTIGGTFTNIMRARDIAVKLWNENWVVICPHLNTFLMDGLCPDSVWLEGDLEIISRCDAIYMLKGWGQSEGSKEECKVALELGKTVIYEEKETEVYGELEKGETFLLNPDWVKAWEEDKIQTCKEHKDETLET